MCMCIGSYISYIGFTANKIIYRTRYLTSLPFIFIYLSLMISPELWIWISIRYEMVSRWCHICMKLLTVKRFSTILLRFEFFQDEKMGNVCSNVLPSYIKLLKYFLNSKREQKSKTITDFLSLFLETVWILYVTSLLL